MKTVPLFEQLCRNGVVVPQTLEHFRPCQLEMEQVRMLTTGCKSTLSRMSKRRQKGQHQNRPHDRKSCRSSSIRSSSWLASLIRSSASRIYRTASNLRDQLTTSRRCSVTHFACTAPRSLSSFANAHDPACSHVRIPCPSLGPESHITLPVSDPGALFATERTVPYRCTAARLQGGFRAPL